MYVEDLLEFFARSHMSALAYYLEVMADGPVRFSELRDQLGISPNTLSQRLKEFVDAGLATRTSYDENPPRVEYEITDKARELAPAFKHLHDWCMENTLFPDSEDDVAGEAGVVLRE